MGFGDDEPPALRADPFPATLQGPGGFKLLILTFISWDVLKLTIIHGNDVKHIQIDATGESTEFTFSPSQSGQLYSFVAQGCSRALDGSTGFCSPESPPLRVEASTNTNSLKQFLMISGRSGDSLRTVVRGSLGSSLRAIMGLEG